MKPRTKVIYYKTMKIVFDDWKDLTKEEVIPAIHQSLDVVQQQEPGNTYSISDVTNCYYDKDCLKYLEVHATPIDDKYIVAHAIVGLGPLQSFILKAVQMFAKRPFYVAKTMDEAQEWLYRKYMEREAKKLAKTA